MAIWYGAYGPAGMSKEIVARFNAEIGRILFLPEVKNRMEDIAVETAKSKPEELATLTRADADKWGKIIKQLGITPRRPIGNSRVATLLEEIVRPQHHRSFSVDWPFEELTRCSLLNRVAQPQKLIYSLICLHLMLAFEVVHRRGADRTPHCLALIKHREIDDHPIEVVAQYFASLQRHCKSSVLKRSDYAISAGLARCARGHREADAQCGELFAVAIEKRIVADNERACAHLGQGRENGIEASFAAMRSTTLACRSGPCDILCARMTILAVALNLKPSR